MTATEAPALTSTRLIGVPWELQEVVDGIDFPAITTLDHWGVLDLASCGLSKAQGRRFSAIHEAAHAVLFHKAGYGITAIELYPDDPRSPDPWQQPGDGHTSVGELRPGAHCMPGAVFSAILAGQVATEMWLEREGLANDRSRLLTYSTAAFDHERLLSIAEGAVFLYGDVKAPAGKQWGAFRIDALAAMAKRDLAKRWSTVAAIAEFVDVNGKAGGEQLAVLLAGR